MQTLKTFLNSNQQKKKLVLLHSESLTTFLKILVTSLFPLVVKYQLGDQVNPLCLFVCFLSFFPRTKEI